MRTNLYTHDGIDVKYIYLPPKTTAPLNKLAVVITNPINKDGHVDFLFTLNQFTNIPRLFIVNDKALNSSLLLIKDKAWLVRDAFIALIEKYRGENDTDAKDVFIITYCDGCPSGFIISLEKGYNAIMSMLLFEKHKLALWKDEDPRIEEFVIRWGQRSDAEGYLFPSVEAVCAYTKLSPDEVKYLLVEYVRQLPREKLHVPKLYLHYGKHDVRYIIDGRQTMEALGAYGINFEAHVDDEEYDHFDASPFFIRYLTALLKNLMQ